MGFDRMTPVQAAAIPLFLGNKDVVVEVRLKLSRHRKDNIDILLGSHWQWKDPGVPNTGDPKALTIRRTTEETPCRRNYRVPDSRTRNPNRFDPSISTQIPSTLGRTPGTKRRWRNEKISFLKYSPPPASTLWYNNYRPRSKQIPQKLPKSAHSHPWKAARSTVVSTRPLPAVLVRRPGSRRGGSTA
jgi:hypothetical protein